MKNIFVGIFIILSSFPLFATPDQERNITDVLLGYCDDELIIYQTIFDNKGSHYNGIYERYIIVKRVEDHQLKLIAKIKIESDSEITKYISRDDFIYAIPDIRGSDYFYLDKDNSNKINYYGKQYDLTKILPKELLIYNVDRIEQVYDLSDRVLIILNFVSQNKIESLRKVVLLFERNK